MHIYLITDNRPAEQLIHLIQPLLDDGLQMIQLRNKQATPIELEETLNRIVPLIASYQANLIINDHVAFAHQFGVGVHLGVSDGDPISARALLGPEAIIGITIHNDIDRAKKYDSVANYVGVGPVFPTSTKPDAKEVIGVQGLSHVIEKSPLPVVAIGGIHASSLHLLQKPLPDYIAVCSAICSASNPLRAFKTLRSIHQTHTG